MEAAPDLVTIVKRLNEVTLEPWGPDGVRYVSILCLDYHGYRALRNVLTDVSWPRWDETSGAFWDLFWAGCFRYQGHDFYGDRALPLTDGSSPVLWSPAKSKELVADLEARAASAQRKWRFSGPIELVVVGARRAGAEIDIDWESIRATHVHAEELGTATAAYTEAHIQLDPDRLGDFPAPGDFEDDLPPLQVLRAMAKRGPQLLRALGLGG